MQPLRFVPDAEVAWEQPNLPSTVGSACYALPMSDKAHATTLATVLFVVGIGLFVYGFFGLVVSAGTPFGPESGWDAKITWLDAERIEMTAGAMLLSAGIFLSRRSP